MKVFKIALMGLILTNFVTSPSFAGSESGGGGGKKEPLFKTVASNIEQWIVSGNADALEEILIQNGLNLSDYKFLMLRELRNYNITFTDDKVLVNGREKTCRSYHDENRKGQIICNNTQFGSDTDENIEEIYRQVHHEFAGLACKITSSGAECIEQNQNEESDYRISNYISAYLEEDTVLRLPVNTDGTSAQCHPLAGVWVEDGFIEAYKADPCSVVARDAVDTQTGAVRDVLKLDRYKIECNGDTKMVFGFDGDPYDDNSSVIDRLAFNKSGFLYEDGYVAKYVRIQKRLLNQMFESARQCIRSAL